MLSEVMEEQEELVVMVVMVELEVVAELVMEETGQMDH